MLEFWWDIRLDIQSLEVFKANEKKNFKNYSYKDLTYHQHQLTQTCQLILEERFSTASLCSVLNGGVRPLL